MHWQAPCELDHSFISAWRCYLVVANSTRSCDSKQVDKVKSLLTLYQVSVLALTMTSDFDYFWIKWYILTSFLTLCHQKSHLCSLQIQLYYAWLYAVCLFVWRARCYLLGGTLHFFDTLTALTLWRFWCLLLAHFLLFREHAAFWYFW